MRFNQIADSMLGYQSEGSNLIQIVGSELGIRRSKCLQLGNK